MQQAGHTISGVRAGGKALPVVFFGLIQDLFMRIIFIQIWPKVVRPAQAAICGVLWRRSES